MAPRSDTQRLKDMARVAKQRREAGTFWFDIGGVKRYVRINSGKFKSVSLDIRNPCGQLVRNGKDVGPTAVLSRALESASSIEVNLPVKDPAKTNKKPEHRVQAFLIYQALSNPKEFPNLLDCSDKYDALSFVTEELPVGNIRADMVFLGEKNGRYFPVFFELKSRRTTEVASQLKDINQYAGDPELTQAFTELLSAATGIPEAKIHPELSEQVAIWNQSPSGKERADIVDPVLGKDSGITMIHFPHGALETGNFTFNSPR